MYIRYIHKLCDLHLQAEDFTGNARRRLFPSPLQCACVTLPFIYSGRTEEDRAERACAAEETLELRQTTNQCCSSYRGKHLSPVKNHPDAEIRISAASRQLEGRGGIDSSFCHSRFIHLFIYFLPFFLKLPLSLNRKTVLHSSAEKEGRRLLNKFLLNKCVWTAPSGVCGCADGAASSPSAPIRCGCRRAGRPASRG